MNQIFIGIQTHSIDSQRRIAIPSDWRHGAPDPMVFFMVPGRKRTIQVLPQALFQQEILEKVKKVSFANAEQAQALARIGALAHRSVCDKQGRISLTQQLMEHAGLDDQATLVGGVKSIQIMSPATWTESQMKTDDVLDEIERIQSSGEI